jgi:hypothetical protein
MIASDGQAPALFWSCMFIVSAAQADEATAIMAIKDTRIFSWLGLRCFHTQQSMLITEKAFDLRAG